MYGPSVRFYLGPRLMGEAPDYVTLDAVWKIDDAGTMELETPGVLDWYMALPSPAHNFVSVVVDGVVPWTGIVDTVEVETGPDGVSTRVTATGARVVLDRLLVYPNNTGTIYDQGGAEKLIRTGPAAQIARDLIVECAARQGVPVHVVATDDVEASRSTTVEAKFDPLGEVIDKALKAAAWTLRAHVWHPGLPSPATQGVAPGDVIVTLAPAELNPRVQWRDEDGPTSTLTVEHATGGTLVVPHEAEDDTDDEGDADRRTTWETVTDPALSAELGRWAGLQSYAGTSEEDDAWTSLTGGIGIELDTTDGEPYVFGQDYHCGDIVTGRVAGIEARAQISEVSLKVDNSGITISPTLGEPKADGLSSLVAVVARLYREAEKRAIG